MHRLVNIYSGFLETGMGADVKSELRLIIGHRPK